MWNSGPSHDEYCDCGACQNVYRAHNNGKWCYCSGCQTRREVIVITLEPSEERRNVATVNFCERCESMGVSTAMGEINFKTAPGEKVERKELCPGCISDLMLWFNDITTTREKAYRHPWKPTDETTTGDIIAKSEVKKLLRELLAGDDNGKGTAS